MSVRWVTTGAAAVLALLLACCSSTTVISNPTPSLGCGTPNNINCALIPTGITAGSQNFTLFIAGSGFISTTNGDAGNSVAYLNGSARPTTYNLNTGQLLVTIYASDVATAGQDQVSVVNPAPGGGPSPIPATFYIHAPQAGDPVLTSLSPNTVAAGSKAFTLTVNGSNFVSGYVVSWNGAWKTTTFVNSTQLTASIPATDIATAGCASVAVVNNEPGGSASVAMDVLVTGTGAPSDCTSTPSSSSMAFPRVVSVSSQGSASNGPSFSPAMSADGRFVAFHSTAKNIVAGKYGNIFVRDTCLGASAPCTPMTRAVDLAPDGSAPNGVAGDQLAISGDGRFVAFSSYATNLGVNASPSAASPVSSVYVRDLCLGRDTPAGCTPHTDLVSVSPAGNPANGSSITPSLSGDGRFVAFASWATNLVPGASASQIRVFVRDLCNGPSASESCIPQTTVVPQAKAASGASTAADHPSISSDGRFVAFQQWVPRAGTSQLGSVVFLRDMCQGLDALPSCVPSTSEISVAPDSQVLAGVSESASVSADGRFVAFASQPDSASGASSAGQAIYLRDTCLGESAPDGCVPSTTLIATAAPSGVPYSPSIAPGGRFISFLVGPPDSDTADANSHDGIIYVYDTCFGAASACTPQAAALTSSSTASSAGLLAGDKFTPVPLSLNGRYAAFYSSSHIAAQPASGVGDVFQGVTTH
ncbi:MAG TPA: IPT/TIG domain-containing protein [Verrucomicrobiae bacterium]|nr:IPT/TIG domain-containing protein [Verrucomicrobiae bacterium]